MGQRIFIVSRGVEGWDREDNDFILGFIVWVIFRVFVVSLRIVFEEVY